jgi:Leucine-rich repeat (LRR) protein
VIKRNSRLFENNWAISLEVIKAKSEEILFNKLTMRATISAIRPEARFLFSNLNHLVINRLSLNYHYRSSENVYFLSGMIQQFKKLSLFSESFSIELRLSRPSTSSFLNSICYEPVSISIKEQFISTTTHLKSLDMNWAMLVDFVPSLLPDNNLTGSAASCTWPSLSELTITNYHRTTIDNRIAKSFPLLKKLEIYKTKKTDIMHLAEDAFAGAVHLTSLSVVSTHTDKGQFSLTGKIFHDLVNLKRLKIRLDKKETIRNLGLLSQLEELDLSHSSFDQINAFPYLLKLKKLDLANCSIRKIDANAFNRLLSLQELNLSENKDPTASNNS